MDLATSYDVIVLGTGLVESLVAAAASRVGKSVLQLDTSSHYGGQWATLSWDVFLACLEEGACSGITGLEVVEAPGSSDLGRARDFMVDLAPRPVFGAGSMVDALLVSGAHHYTEFKLLQASYMLDGEGALLTVPSTRAEVFASRDLPLKDKRVLMRFMQRLAELQARHEAGTAVTAPGGKLAEMSEELRTPFQEFMTRAGLIAPGLRASLAHGMLLLPGPLSSTTGQALARLETVHRSVGRYGAGKGALLCSMYGGGELAQSFCRVAAVGGAVQMLRCPALQLAGEEGAGGLDGAAEEEGKAVGNAAEEGGAASTDPRHTAILLGDERQRIWAGAVVGGAAVLAGLLDGSGMEGPAGSHQLPPSVLRCVAVLDGPSLLPSQAQVLVTVPQPDGSVVWALAMGHALSVCPANRCLLYLWTSQECSEQQRSARSVLEPVVRALIAATASIAAVEEDSEGATGEQGSTFAGPPAVLYAVYYAQQDGEVLGTLPRNVTMCPGPGADLSYDDAVAAARDVYMSLFADEARFPLDPIPPAPYDEDAASDDEALTALQAAVEGMDIPGQATAPREGPQIDGQERGETKEVSP